MAGSVGALGSTRLSPMGKTVRPFDRTRRQRHDAEYPPSDAPELTAGDVHEDVAKAAEIVFLAQRVLDHMSPA